MQAFRNRSISFPRTPHIVQPTDILLVMLLLKQASWRRHPIGDRLGDYFPFVVASLARVSSGPAEVAKIYMENK